MHILLLGCSLSAHSRSHVLAREAADVLATLGADVTCVDLRTQDLIFCDGRTSNDCVRQLKAQVAAADAVVFAVPIYNYDVNAAAKAVVEHAGRAFENKLVAFLCAAGGHGSYMSVMSLANSLMLDFRCLVVPRFVYATKGAFADGQLVDDTIRQRVDQLCREVMRIGTALKEAPAVEART